MDSVDVKHHVYLLTFILGAQLFNRFKSNAGETSLRDGVERIIMSFSERITHTIFNCTELGAQATDPILIPNPHAHSLFETHGLLQPQLIGGHVNQG